MESNTGVGDRDRVARKAPEGMTGGQTHTYMQACFDLEYCTTCKHEFHTCMLG